jgi:cytochrome-b5 reductase
MSTYEIGVLDEEDCAYAGPVDDVIPQGSTIFAMSEVQRHNGKITPHSYWFAIYNKVYDVTKFGGDHPGGVDVLRNLSGSDATQPFAENNHSRRAMELMKKYYIGELRVEDRKKHPPPRKPGDVENKKMEGKVSTDQAGSPVLARVQEQLFFLFLVVGVGVLFFLWIR